MKITGKLTEKDGINEIKRGVSKGKEWVLFGGSIKVDGKKYNLKAAFEDHKDDLEDMLEGLMMNDTVEVTVDKNAKGYDEVTGINQVEQVKETTPTNAEIEEMDYETVTVSDDGTPERKTNSLLVQVTKATIPEELAAKLNIFGADHNVRATQVFHDTKHDEWVGFSYYD